VEEVARAQEEGDTELKHVTLNIFSMVPLHYHVKNDSGLPSQSLIQFGDPGVKRMERETDHPLPSSTEVYNVRMYTPQSSWRGA